MVANILREIAVTRTSVRDLAALSTFVDHLDISGSAVLYGIGTVAEAILPVLRRKADLLLVGAIDRRADNITVFHGLPVTAPERFDPESADLVILCHHTQEGGMAATLAAQGFRGQVIPLFSNPNFAAFNNKTPETAKFRDHSGGACIISTTGPEWSVISNQELAAMLPADRTTHLFFGRSDMFLAHFSDDPFPVVDCHQSIAVVEQFLTTTRPRFVYLRTSPHLEGEYLILLVKRCLPDAIVINEFYDFGCLFRSDRLTLSYGFGEQEIAISRYSEWYASLHADLVISKNGGALWNKVVRGFRARHCTYFPRIIPREKDESEPDLPMRTSCQRIFFAGTMSPPERIGGLLLHSDLNYFEYFEPLAQTGCFVFDVYNASHFLPDHDRTFQIYSERYTLESAIRYHRRVPVHQVMAIMQEADLAWHACHNLDLSLIQPISRVVTGNKFTTYIQAGLPIVVDSFYDHMASMVREYEAGIVIHPLDIDGAIQSLSEANPAMLRRGVERLHQHMLTTNRATLAIVYDMAKSAIESGSM
ncbi:hypothetical protein [Azospirillum griseum]|uniref:Glucosyltransferase 3-like C-terminal domain-containing protein n=1 Tax=Azospirillum griseum TaxID=2496639 RepID=A0A3S0HW76_9PROT|nr:hypothetical protein [Azospirillum griseum]RTR12010.1 hypothetical protein EJ903_25750 [Azospirillum griseum]